MGAAIEPTPGSEHVWDAYWRAMQNIDKTPGVSDVKLLGMDGSATLADDWPIVVEAARERWAELYAERQAHKALREIAQTTTLDPAVKCPRCGQPSSESLDGMAWCPHCNGAHRWLRVDQGREAVFYRTTPAAPVLVWSSFPAPGLEAVRGRTGKDGLTFTMHEPHSAIADPPEPPPYVSRPCPCGLAACMCERGR